MLYWVKIQVTSRNNRLGEKVPLLNILTKDVAFSRTFSSWVTVYGASQLRWYPRVQLVFLVAAVYLDASVYAMLVLQSGGYAPYSGLSFSQSLQECEFFRHLSQIEVALLGLGVL